MISDSVLSVSHSCDTPETLAESQGIMNGIKFDIDDFFKIPHVQLVAMTAGGRGITNIVNYFHYQAASGFGYAVQRCTIRTAAGKVEE
jgi:hypothetical protein